MFRERISLKYPRRKHLASSWDLTAWLVRCCGKVINRFRVRDYIRIEKRVSSNVISFPTKEAINQRKISFWFASRCLRRTNRRILYLSSSSLPAVIRIFLRQRTYKWKLVSRTRDVQSRCRWRLDVRQRLDRHRQYHRLEKLINADIKWPNSDHANGFSRGFWSYTILSRLVIRLVMFVPSLLRAIDGYLLKSFRKTIENHTGLMIGRSRNTKAIAQVRTRELYVTFAKHFCNRSKALLRVISSITPLDVHLS